MMRLRVSLLLVCLASAMTASAQVPAPRAGHAMTTAGPGGGVFLLGGQINDELRVVDTLWLWDAGSWRALASNGPSSRSLPAAAFDSKRNALVVYGGVAIGSGTRYGDTWEWRNGRWTELNIRTPGARDHHAMVFDEARGKIVMYGGAVPSSPPYIFPNDTWTFDGRVWERVDSSSAPGGLVHHAMAYDARRQRTVLLGGFGTNNQRMGDTWEWDGARWQKIAVSGESPSPRSHHRMAYDAARGNVVLFGGDDTGETWTWDGTRWTRHATAGPPPTNVHAMAYDARRGRVVLFGGSNRDGVPPYSYSNTTWEWDGAGWTKAETTKGR